MTDFIKSNPVYKQFTVTIIVFFIFQAYVRFIALINQHCLHNMRIASLKKEENPYLSFGNFWHKKKKFAEKRNILLPDYLITFTFLTSQYYNRIITQSNLIICTSKSNSMIKSLVIDFLSFLGYLPLWTSCCMCASVAEGSNEHDMSVCISLVTLLLQALGGHMKLY